MTWRRRSIAAVFLCLCTAASAQDAPPAASSPLHMFRIDADQIQPSIIPADSSRPFSQDLENPQMPGLSYQAMPLDPFGSYNIDASVLRLYFEDQILRRKNFSNIQNFDTNRLIDLNEEAIKNAGNLTILRTFDPEYLQKYQGVSLSGAWLRDLLRDNKSIVNPDPEEGGTSPSDPIPKQTQLTFLEPSGAEVTASVPDDSDALGCNDVALPSIIPSETPRNPKTVAPRQFPEVVRLTIRRAELREPEICSGTVVGENWVLTAAHCLTSKASAANANDDPAPVRDYIWTDSSADLRQISGEAGSDVPGDYVRIEANNLSGLLSSIGAIRFADRAVVNWKYSRADGVTHDVALVHFALSYAPQQVVPARIADAFDPISTIAGYGYANAGAGLGQFYLGSPPEVRADGEFFVFEPSDGATAFCQGDSGGPMFSGLPRGCQPNDSVKEERPRRLQGTISNNLLSDDGDPVQACLKAKMMSAFDITTLEIRSWLCTVAENKLLHCAG